MIGQPTSSDERQSRSAALPRRRWLARVHTWTALALSLYVVMLSVTGSVIVFRRELNQWLVPRTVASTEGERLTGETLRSAVERVYSGHTLVEVREPTRVDRPVFIGLERNGERDDRYFDPYALQDLGSTYPDVLRAVEWLVDLHDNLLSGPEGRTVNGVGGALVILLIVTGLIIWWPGWRRAWRSMLIGRPAASRRFAWQVHNAFGIWSFALLFVWALTAVYFAFPDYFERSIDYFDADKSDDYRPGEAVLLGMIQLHFGRFGGLTIRVLWFVLGLLPAALFVTGFVLWWTRVVRRRARS
jgi:uncharacterized iron-regulated membrane protein